MDYYAGIDVSLEQSSVCVVDATGKIVRETKVASEPEALVALLKSLGYPLQRVGLEAGPLSQWLYAGLAEAGFEVALLETRHVKAALSAMTVKTDRKDARGIAQLLRMGWFRQVHCKTSETQEMRALLVGRKLLQSKLLDIEGGIRGLLRGFGLKMGSVSKGRFVGRVEELVVDEPMLKSIVTPMLSAREALRLEYSKLHRAVLAIVRTDQVCRRLMTTTGVGAVVSLTFKSGIDDPRRFKSSKTVGAYFGLTPKKYQSGETDITGGISRVGDAMVRTALYEAAQVILHRATGFSSVKRWALDVAKRRGMKRATVALARKLATILHRMWVDETDFRWGKDATAA
jgi:transposase